MAMLQMFNGYLDSPNGCWCSNSGVCQSRQGEARSTDRDLHACGGLVPSGLNIFFSLRQVEARLEAVIERDPRCVVFHKE